MCFSNFKLLIQLLLIWVLISCGTSTKPMPNAKDVSKLEENFPGAKHETFPDEEKTSQVNPGSVDVGNPSETGPDPKKSKVYIADAVPADGATAVWVTLTGMKLIGKNAGLDFNTPITRQRINLMDYSEGAKLELFHDVIPDGEFTELVFTIADDEPVVLTKNGVDHPVFVATKNYWENGVGGSQGFVLYGAIDINTQDNTIVDLTMHVDLRFAIRPITSSVRADLGVVANGFEYWMVPENKSFISETVGNLVLLGLENQLATVICAYPSDFIGLGPIISLGGLLPPIFSIGNNACYDAQGSAAKKNGQFYLGYLDPGSYRLRLFIGTLYLDIPPILTVTSGLTSFIDLSGIISLLP